MITHEEARNKVKSNHNKFYTEGEFTKDMFDYISQQEKKDELLGLYHKALDMMVKTQFQNQTPHYVVRHTDDLVFNNIVDKIKTLEKELGEI